MKLNWNPFDLRVYTLLLVDYLTTVADPKLKTMSILREHNLALYREWTAQTSWRRQAKIMQTWRYTVSPCTHKLKLK